MARRLEGVVRVEGQEATDLGDDVVVDGRPGGVDAGDEQCARREGHAAEVRGHEGGVDVVEEVLGCLTSSAGPVGDARDDASMRWTVRNGAQRTRRRPTHSNSDALQTRTIPDIALSSSHEPHGGDDDDDKTGRPT